MSDFIIDIGGNIADGPWISKWVQITPDALSANGFYVYNLVNNGYLPNDVYDYELMISCWLWTSTTINSEGSIWVYNKDLNTSNNSIGIETCYNVLRVSGFTCTQCASIILPIWANQKVISFKNIKSAALNSWGFQLTGYKRLGTNV